MEIKPWKENNLLYKLRLLEEENTIPDILLEKIYGNVAIVYHRGGKYKLNYLLNGTYKNRSHIDFENYNQALYTTFDLESQLNIDNSQINNMQGTYGDYIIKLAVKGISNFWFCDYEIYKQYHPNTTPETWKEEQFKKFNISKKLWIKFGDDSLWFNHVTVSKIFEEFEALGKRVKGIVYYGKHDGNCALIYDWTTVVPISISEDEGKTWQKVSKEETENLRRNFNKNDYINISKRMSNPYFTITVNGDVIVDEDASSLLGVPKEVKGNFICTGCKSLESLKGAPQKVGGYFDCSNCWKLTSLEGAPQIANSFSCNNCKKLTSLEGAPIMIDGSFRCAGCKSLTSLKGAPQIVGGNFYCFDCENLTSLDGAPTTVGGNFDCSICSNLESLEGFNTKIGGSFDADYKIEQLYNQKYKNK